MRALARVSWRDPDRVQCAGRLNGCVTALAKQQLMRLGARGPDALAHPTLGAVAVSQGEPGIGGNWPRPCENSVLEPHWAGHGRLNFVDTKSRSNASGAQRFEERTGSHDSHHSLQVVR